jgi:hypothetical protein
MPQFPAIGVYHDGDVTKASPSGGLETEAPFPFQPWTRIFRQKFQQHYDYWAPLAPGTNPINGGMSPPVAFDGNTKTGRGPFLVEETELQDLGGGIREWTRVWAHIPAMIYEFPSLNYLRQQYSVSSVPWMGFTDTWGSFHGIYRTYTSIEEWTEPTTALVHRQFLRVPDNTNINKMLKAFKVLIPFRIIKFNDSRGKEHVYQIGTPGVAQATQINRWMGDIWELVNTYVNPSPLGGSSSSGLTQAGFTTWNLPGVLGTDANGNPTGAFTTPPGWIGGVGGDT